MARKEKLELTVTLAEKKKIVDAAEKAEQSIATYMREQLLKVAK